MPGVPPARPCSGGPPSARVRAPAVPARSPPWSLPQPGGRRPPALPEARGLGRALPSQARRRRQRWRRRGRRSERAAIRLQGREGRGRGRAHPTPAAGDWLQPAWATTRDARRAGGRDLDGAGHREGRGVLGSATGEETEPPTRAHRHCLRPPGAQGEIPSPASLSLLIRKTGLSAVPSPCSPLRGIVLCNPDPKPPREKGSLSCPRSHS